MTQNQLTFWANQEAARANRAREQETHRSNLQNELLKMLGLELQGNQLEFDKTKWSFDYDLNQRKLGLEQGKLGLEKDKLAESVRSHKADESERQRMNSANIYNMERNTNLAYDKALGDLTLRGAQTIWDIVSSVLGG